MNESPENLRLATTIEQLEEYVLGTWRDVYRLEYVHPDDLDRVRLLFGIDELEAGFDASDADIRFATDAQRNFIYLRDQRQCAYCDIPLDPRQMQADHLEPFSRGGKTRVDNLVCACKACNYAKGIMDPLEFIELLDEKGLEERDRLYQNWLLNVRLERGY